MNLPRRILLIRPSALGDVCRTVPLVASLHAAWPDARIDWMVNAPFTEAVKAHPAVAGVIPFDRRALGRSLKRANPAPLAKFIVRLRGGSYDIVIDAQGLARSAAFAWLTRAPIRVGHDDAREHGTIPLTHRVHANGTFHTVDRMLTLLRPLGVPIRHDMTLTAPPRCVESADRLIEADEPPIVLAPTSIWPGKSWPIERFVAIADRLLESGLGPIAVVGSPNEREQCAPLLEASRPGVIDLVGKTSVGELMAVIQRSRLVVANDSAALHIAVGFDRPIVALFGPTDTARVGPYRRDRDVIQHAGDEPVSHKDREAGRRLMERITVDEVEAAVRQRL